MKPVYSYADSGCDTIRMQMMEGGGYQHEADQT
jgi:hypothetical protein